MTAMAANNIPLLDSVGFIGSTLAYRLSLSGMQANAVITGGPDLAQAQRK